MTKSCANILHITDMELHLGFISKYHARSTFLIEVELIYNVELVFSIQRNDVITHTHTYFS